MKSCVVTTAFGDEWAKIAAKTKPRMEEYCKRHGHDFISLEKPLVEPVQYTKLVIGNILATRGYEVATFFDCDVLIARDCPDIAKDAGVFCALDEGAFLDRKPGLKELAKAYGGNIEPRFYVNTGVFVIAPKAIGALSMPPIGLNPNHFAEQSWMNIMLHLWGVELTELDPSFNCMTSVEQHFGLDRYRDAYVIHYAGQSGDLNKLGQQIEADDKKLEENSR